MTRSDRTIGSWMLLLALLLATAAWAEEPKKDGGDKAPPPASQPGDESGTGPNQVAGETDKSKIVRFKEPTPEEAKTALEEARKRAEETVKQLKINLRLAETKHFLIYTDWPKNEEKWLTNIFEEMYRGLAKQFATDPNKTIWYGKLSVFAFVAQEDFRRFAAQIDGVNVPAMTAGYAAARGDGRGHIALWQSGAHEGMATVIVHEGTHAFLSRYKSNLHICSWLNEGLAQWMVNVGVPNTSQSLRRAQMMSADQARRKVRLDAMFDSRGNIPFELYPVAMTVTDMMLMKSKKKYVDMINDIKDGMDVEDAIKKNYEWTYKDLSKYWYKWAERGFK